MDNNRANQLNPNNLAFWRSRGYSDRPTTWLSLALDFVVILAQAGLDNRSNQLNPTSQVFWSSRGQSRP